MSMPSAPGEPEQDDVSDILEARYSDFGVRMDWNAAGLKCAWCGLLVIEYYPPRGASEDLAEGVVWTHVTRRWDDPGGPLRQQILCWNALRMACRDEHAMERVAGRREIIGKAASAVPDWEEWGARQELKEELNRRESQGERLWGPGAGDYGKFDLGLVRTPATDRMPVNDLTVFSESFVGLIDLVTDGSDGITVTGHVVPTERGDGPWEP